MRFPHHGVSILGLNPGQSLYIYEDDVFRQEPELFWLSYLMGYYSAWQESLALPIPEGKGRLLRG